MRFSLDVPVEKRSLKARDAIRLDLEFPPPIESARSQADWQARAGPCAGQPQAGAGAGAGQADTLI